MPSPSSAGTQRPQSHSLAAAALAVVAGLYGSLYCLWGDPLRGLAGLIVGACAMSPLLAAADSPATVASRRAALPGMLLVAAALIFFRCYRLDPPGLWGDDAINGLLALDVLNGEIRSPFRLVHHSHSYFHAFTNQVIAFAFLLVGPGPTGLRLPGIAAGIAAGLAVYAALRRLFGSPAALVAGLFFAASPLQISHSKNLIQEVFGLAFQCIGVACLVRGLAAVSGTRGDEHDVAAPDRAPPVLWWAAAAVAFAATVYTYHAAKLAPLVALPLLFARRRDFSTADRRALGVALATFALCLLPALFVYARDPSKLTGRFAGVSLLTELRAAGSLAPLWESTWRTLAVFHYQQGPPRYHWFGIGDEPGLDPIVGFLAVCGFAASLRRWREPRHLLLLSWFAIGLIPGILSTEAPRGYRVLLATPPLYAWAALPIAALWRHAAPAPRGAARALAALLVAAVLFVDFNYYFYRTYTHPDFRWMQGARQVAMARALRRRGPGWRGYLLSPRFSAEYETVRFLSRAWDLRFEDVRILRDIAPLDDVPEGGALFITTPGSHEASELLRAFYPQATATTVFDPPPRTWFFGGDWPYPPKVARREPVATLVAVGHDELVAAQSRRGPRWLPAFAVYKKADGEVIRRREPPPFFNFFADTFEQPFTAHFATAIFVPAPGGYSLDVTGEGLIEMRVDGVLDAPPRVLESGRHVVTISMPTLERRLRLSLWWTPPGGKRGPIPANAWRPLLFRETPPP